MPLAYLTSALRLLIAVPASATAEAAMRDGDASESTAVAVPAGSVMGIDPSGLPIVCGTDLESRAPRPPGRALVPSDTIGWETIPGVIRADGTETFRLEIAVGMDATAVVLESVSPQIVAPASLPLALVDDGTGADRVAGDAIYTASPFGFDPNKHFFAPNYQFDPDSPAGIDTTTVGSVRVDESGGASHAFLLPPTVGLLRADIALVPVQAVSADVAVSAHLMNVRSTNRETQRFMRLLLGGPTGLGQKIYAVLPDVFDFLVLFSTYKVELVPQGSSANFIAGLHSQVQTNYAGTGLGAFDATSLYGSGDKLLSVNGLDTYGRGAVSNNFVHEIMHQWGCYLSGSLGLCDGPHYKQRSSVGSLIGGFLWADDGDGTFGVDCEEGRNGAHHAPPLDLYLAGLVGPGSVAPLQVFSDAESVVAKCNGEPIEANEIVTSASVADIQVAHGPRTPGPEAAPHEFHIGFVAESTDRMLTATEMTFYEILARHATAPMADEAPDPYVGFNWVSMGRFFGPDTTWKSEVCLLDADDDGRCDSTQCMRGDCNGDGSIDAADPICTVLCLVGTPPAAADCACAANCNCVADLEAADPVCTVKRVIGSFSAAACGAVP